MEGSRLPLVGGSPGDEEVVTLKVIHYGTADILTGDAIADAVIEYAGSLAQHHSADTVNVPAIALDGTLTRTKVLIGPASQMIVQDAPDDVLEPRDPEFVRRLEQAGRRLGPHRPLHASEDPRLGRR